MTSKSTADSEVLNTTQSNVDNFFDGAKKKKSKKSRKELRRLQKRSARQADKEQAIEHT